MDQSELRAPVRASIEVAVYLLIIFALIAWCLRIISPFVTFVVWGTVIAVAIHPLFLALRRWVGGRNKLAVTIFVILGLAVILVPAWMFAGSLIGSAESARTSLESGQFNLPPPDASVKSWPLIGEQLYENWSEAASNTAGWLEAHADQIRPIVAGALGKAAGLGLSILQFVLSILIAAGLLANDQSTERMIRRLARRLVNEQADDLIKLSTATVRSVTIGVLGIAFIQAVAGGAGMMLAGVPAAGVWALLILIVAIAQLPPLVVLLPVILYVFSHNDSTLVAVIFAIWSVLVSFADAALKPMLLGRGVDAPMPVILLGAIGGMLYSGIIGLFLGAVILALGYRMFMVWLTSGETPAGEPERETGTG